MSLNRREGAVTEYGLLCPPGQRQTRRERQRGNRNRINPRRRNDSE